MNFEIGKTYQTRSIGDSDCKITYTCIDRTAKTVRMVEGFGNDTLKLNGEANREVKVFRPYMYGGTEMVRPWGRSSMSPILGADDIVQQVAA